MDSDSPRFLVVDDDPEIREAFHDLLEIYEGRIDTAANGEEAFKLAQQTRYDLYLTDILMPQMSGFEFILQLRKLDPDAVIVIISGTDDIAYNMKAIDCGAWRYLVKPVHRDAFYEVVHHGLVERGKHLPSEQQAAWAARITPELQKTAPAAIVAATNKPVRSHTVAQELPVDSVVVRATQILDSAPVSELELADYRQRLQQIKDEAIADFSRQMLAMKSEILQEALRQIDELKAKLLEPKE